MREALIKKRFGVPALLLIFILLTAGSAAAFLVASFNNTTTTAEPLTFTMSDELDIGYQGESDNIVVHVQNLSMKTGYGIFVNNTVKDGRVKSVTYGTYGLVASEPAKGTDFNGDGDEVDAKYNIYPGYSFDITVTIDSADDAKPGEVGVTLDFYRQSEYV